MLSAKDIFLDALELPAAERDAFVEQAGAGDAELVLRVRELLAAHTRAGDVLPDEVVPAPKTPTGSFQAGARVGTYRLIRPIGEGGFGTVWIAEQEGAFRRRAAIKILKAGLDTAEVVARFEAERQALALMEHPSIASVFEGGATESGRPWFAMEFVDGVPITRYCRSRALGTEARLELFLKVCRAIQHAHQKGIIHRDLKPTNVLVADIDGEPTPKVIDFGIAKAVNERLTDRTLKTRAGAFLGTPAYMSPEQVSGVSDVDTRSDVYSLGVLLYEMLCGNPPFDDELLRGASLFEIQRIVREVEPERPSRRIGTLRRAGTSGDATTRMRDVRGELDWIVMRCLEKDRERRYDSVAALGNDVDRHLRGETVLAGPPDVRYRLSKFARRHRTAIATGAAILILIVAGAVIATAQAVRATRAEQDARREARNAAQAERLALDAEKLAREEASRARTELDKYERIALFLQDMFHSVDPEVAKGRDLTLLHKVLDRAEQRVDEESGNPEVEAALRHTIGLAFFATADYSRALPHLERAALLREEYSGANDAETLDTLNDLAGLYLRLGRHADAEPLVLRVLEGRTELHGRADRPTLMTLESLGVLRHEQNRLEESEALFRAVEEGFVRLSGTDDLDAIRASSNLAGVLQGLGLFDEAEERLRHALDVQLAQLGPREPRTLMAMNNLAKLYSVTGRYAEAVELLERAIQVKRELLEPGHPSLIVSLNNLAAAYAHVERLEEAERIYRETLETARGALGERNAMTLNVAHNLGTFLTANRRPEEAEPMLFDAWEGHRAQHGEGHPRTLASKGSYAMALLELERAEEAATLMSEVVKLAPSAYPADHSQPGSFGINLGRCLAACGRVEEALAAFTRGFEIVDAAGDDEERERAVEKLVELLDREGRTEEAAAWRVRSSEAE